MAKLLWHIYGLSKHRSNRLVWTGRSASDHRMRAAAPSALWLPFRPLEIVCIAFATGTITNTSAYALHSTVPYTVRMILDII